MQIKNVQRKMKKNWISIFKDVERENLKKEYSNKIKKKISEFAELRK